MRYNSKLKFKILEQFVNNYIFIFKNEFDLYIFIIVTVYSVSLQFEYLQTEAPWQAEAFKYKYIIIYERLIHRPSIVTILNNINKFAS